MFVISQGQESGAEFAHRECFRGRNQFPKRIGFSGSVPAIFIAKGFESGFGGVQDIVEAIDSEIEGIAPVVQESANAFLESTGGIFVSDDHVVEFGPIAIEIEEEGLNAGPGWVQVGLALGRVEAIDDIDWFWGMAGVVVMVVVIMAAMATTGVSPLFFFWVDPFFEFGEIQTADIETVCELDGSGEAPIEEKIIRRETEFCGRLLRGEESVFGANGVPIFAKGLFKRLREGGEIEVVFEKAEMGGASVLEVEIALLQQFGGLDPAHAGHAHAGIFEDGSDGRHDGLRTHGVRFDIGKSLVSHGEERRLKRKGAVGKGIGTIGEWSDDFAMTAEEPFVGHDAFESDGAARVDFSGRDADFGT